MRYIKTEEFKDFQKNQEKLIEILNHNMTKIQQDIRWIKLIQSWQAGLVFVIMTGIMVKIFTG